MDVVSPPRITRAYVETSFGQVHYRRLGGGGDPLLLLLHQTASSSRMFERLMPLLRRGGWSSVAMDTPGFGESDPPPRYFSVHDYAASVVEFAERLGARGPLTLLGHHTGAAVAVEVAASWPARVSKLVLVGVPLFLSADARRKRWEERGVQAIIPAPDAEHLLRVWKGLEALSPDTDVSLRHRELVDALKAPRYDQAYRAVLLEYDCEARLRLVACPTLIVAGTREPLFGSQEAAARFVPRSTLAIVQGGGTFMLDERTEQVAQIVLGFLGVPADGGPAPDRP